MKLHASAPSRRNAFTGYGEGFVQVNGQRRESSVLVTPEQVEAGLKGTQDFIASMFQSVAAGAKAGRPLREVYRETYARLKPQFGHWVIFDHCMPFDVSRAYDEAKGIKNPRIWTAERDKEMWAALQA